MVFQEVACVRLWDGSVVDMNNILRISLPYIHTASYGSLAEAYVGCTIYSKTGKDICIREFISSDDSFTDKYYRCVPSKIDAKWNDKIVEWLCTDGSWSSNAKDSDLKVYADFKEKIDTFIAFWNKHNPVLEVGESHEN